ncbi:Hsp20/alpha crystallin family protein [Candidatus Peregrinibacteria bacterium]|nr:Hsp20/alpha crystallin family protein [Candidatus Peregrinibacteria bacterium]
MTHDEKRMTVRDEMDRFFDDPFAPFFKPFFNDPFFGGRKAFVSSAFPLIDVSENEKELKVVADIPGYDPKEVDVEVKDNVLTISGKKEHEIEEKGKKFYRKERSSGSFTRSFALPYYTDAESIECSAKNGTLTVVIPKKAEAKGKKIAVKVK